MLKQSNNLEIIIRPFLTDNLSEKQKIEICHVGKFLTLLEGKIEIVERSESPDFIISFNGEMIGLEHERIINTSNKKNIKSKSEFFFNAAKIFKTKYPGYNVLVNFWLEDLKFEWKKNEAPKLWDQIADYIYSQINKDTLGLKPEFIDDILIMNHNKVCFKYNEGPYYVNNIEKKLLFEAIQKKESKLNNYKYNSKLEKQWLLIVIGETSADSYEFEEDHDTIEIKTDYDKIFLMEDFNCKLREIKKCKSDND